MNAYTTWFYFGIRGLKKGAYIKLSIINLNYSRPFSSPSYRPVYRSLPKQSEWQRVQTEPMLEPNNAQFKYSWTYESMTSDPEHYFAFALPYPYSDIQKNLTLFEKSCPSDSLFYKETIIKSIDGKDIDLITISNRVNFTKEREQRIPSLFQSNVPRVFKSYKPVIFISARVHPGETPASFLLDGLLMVILGNDTRGHLLRSNFVFKIIPVLNPDGVYRGNFRVDQNGVNLNRCYQDPSLFDHPSIYAVREYFLSIPSVKYYFDLHSQMSKKSCFLFGNYLGPEKQAENEIFAKLFELNSQYFELNDCDFSEKSMSAKDPKDQNSKEGSGRVSFFNATGIIHSYTIESANHIARPLHMIPQTINLRTGKRFSESTFYNTSFLTPVYNRAFYCETAVGMLTALLDLEEINLNSRLPLSEFRSLECMKEYLKAKNQGQVRILNKHLIRNEFCRSKNFEKTCLPKLPQRKTHKIHTISPIFTSAAQGIYQKPKVLPLRTKSIIKY